MSVESLVIYLLGLGILASHLFTLRILMDCKTHLTISAGDLSDRGSTLCESMEEVIRIGTDLADLMESVVDSGITQSIVQPSPPMNLKDTMIQLMVDRALGQSHGSETEQSRAIYEQENETED